MDKGWGLTLKSDPSALAFFSNNSNNNKPPSSPPVNCKRSFDMGTDSLRMFQFPVHREAATSSPADDNRVVVGEVDFFSDKRNRAVDDHRDHDHHPDDDGDTKGSVSVKKENNSLGEAAAAAAAPRSSSDVNTGLHLLTANTGSDQSTVDDGVSSDVDEKRSKSELAQLQVELQRLKEENQRLRDMLNQVTNNYSALQMHLVALMQQQQQAQLQKNRTVAQNAQEHEHLEVKSDQDKKDYHQQVVPRQFLDLGRPSAETDELSHSSSGERTRSGTPQNHLEAAAVRNNAKSEMASYDQENSSGKRIAREESPESESQGWNPNKFQKLNPANNKAIEQSSEATMRKARVSVRARSEAPMISDGCQWRKYGQKMAKGNPCPRAYYRCTMAVGCPVRKQVQRCADDRTILITTYEGNHNHPLPPAAMAMASTTTAAASMLLSGSMSSADGIMNPNLLARAILPCSSSMATISASAPFPTVTLDLTHNSNPIQFQRPPTHFQVPIPSQPQNFAAAASSSVPAGGGASQLPQVLGQALYNQSKFSGLQLSQELVSSQQQAQPTGAQQHSIADTVSAATAAITADPNFTAALAAAITSIIGGANNSSNTSNSNNSNANNTKQHSEQPY